MNSVNLTPCWFLPRGATVLAVALLVAPLFVFADEQAPRRFYVADIKSATELYIASRTDDDGIFRIFDPKTEAEVALHFVKVHDPVRQISDVEYFACTDFEVVGEKGKLYDLDFWMRPDGDKLVVYDEKIHKEPRRSFLYGWFKQPRYTFVNDKVVPLYE